MKASLKTSAWALSLLGVVPFIIPAFWFIFATDDQELIARAQNYMVAYGAIILSFLGGVRWGVALSNERTPHLIWSVVPSLLAWACLLAPTLYQLPALTIGFAAQWFWDFRSTKQGVFPNWFGHLRSFISLCVIVLFIVSILAH